jgi:RND family efflux transporter MFP subunit
LRFNRQFLDVMPINPAHRLPKFRKGQIWSKVVLFAFLGSLLNGCERFWQGVQAQPRPPEERAENQSIAVDVAIAKLGKLRPDIEYTGTTEPIKEVSLRSQVEGQLRQLKVDVGDEVKEGQILAQLDDNLLEGAVNQARAEKAAQNSEVVSAQSQVGDALIKVEQARLQLQQAEADVLRLQTSLHTRIEQARLEVEQTQADAARLSQLAGEGAAATQIAEQAQTKAKQAQQILRNEQVSAEQQISQAKTAAQTAAKILRSAQAQVEIEQQKVAAAEAQVKAQKALITQAKTRQSYATLRSPISGKVLQRSSEQGNLVQPGTEILKLGDFSRIKIAVEVSELYLSRVKMGQLVNIKLDAFPNQKFGGVVSRISPAANPNGRLVPIEITLNNTQGSISGGLLARVSFAQDQDNRIIIPETALQEDSTVFVVKGGGEKSTVEKRPVTVGKKANGQLEILSGLSAGESYVVRSNKPLKNGSVVRLSVLSEIGVN